MADTRARVALNGKQVNLAQLTAEVGVALCLSDVEVVAAEGAPVSQAQLDSAVAAHAADPLWSNEAKVRKKIEDRIVQAENAYANWSTLSNAQKDSALRETMLMTAKIARFLLGRFDAAE